MIPANLVGVRWRRIVPGAVVAFLGSMLVTILIVTGYAFTLGFQARGSRRPDANLLARAPSRPDLGAAAPGAVHGGWGLVGRASGDRPRSPWRPRGSNRRDRRPVRRGRQTAVTLRSWLWWWARVGLAVLSADAPKVWFSGSSAGSGAAWNVLCRLSAQMRRDCQIQRVACTIDASWPQPPPAPVRVNCLRSPLNVHVPAAPLS